MDVLTRCAEPVARASGTFPCVLESGHAGEHSSGRCNARVYHAGNEYECSLHRGHPGRHDTWVREADDDELERGSGRSALDEWGERA